MKKFGADYNDALSLLRPYLDIVFVTGDKRGFEISNKRISDMHFELHLVSTIKRIDWINEHYRADTTIYMGCKLENSKPFICQPRAMAQYSMCPPQFVAKAFQK